MGVLVSFLLAVMKYSQLKWKKVCLGSQSQGSIMVEKSEQKGLEALDHKKEEESDERP